MNREIAQIRSGGYAFDDEEGVAGLGCVAAPIWNGDGLAVAAISSSAATAEVDSERRAGLAAALRGAALRAARLSAQDSESIVSAVDARAGQRLGNCCSRDGAQTRGAMGSHIARHQPERGPAGDGPGGDA